MKKSVALALALASFAPSTAAAAPPNPFGHACTPQSGVLFCPTASDAERVPSWDGVPLDVDVTLPTTHDGPFPTIVMMHGWGGNKSSFEAAAPEGDGGAGYHYNNVYFAQQGIAVITYSARGFGRSCGAPDSRTAGACDRGWVHLADQRYEARDTQYLLGLLADQNIVKPYAIGVTGISYGGIQSHILARLRDRIRLPDGSFRRWISRERRPLRIVAAWPRWGTTDLTNALTPNGRFLDFGPVSAAMSRQPLGVMKQSFTNGLYTLATLTGFVAPEGADPDADLTAWRAATDRGEPYGAGVRAVGRELTTYHSAAGVPGTPVPMLVQNGWTDDLFPATEALRVYRTFKDTEGARIAYQLGDLGHPRGSNKVDVDRYLNTQGADFFLRFLRGRAHAPKHNSFTAFTQTCPKDAAANGPYRARSWESLHPGRVTLVARPPQRVTSSGGNPETGKAFDQILTGDACKTVPAERAAGTALAQRGFRKPVTMLGLPTVRATIKTKGSSAFLAARLWDVYQGNQTLITRGVYRLTDDQQGRIVFQLFGNGWRFGRGHVAKLELLGADSGFLRTSNNAFSVRVSKLRVVLPTR
jgi:predicted acyl esterase